MGLFDRAKNAFGAGASDLAAQAQAAQQLMGEEMRKAGYTDGSMPTMAGAGALQAQAQADHDVLNAYGQEINRIFQIGEIGSGVLRSVVDTGERTAGQAWYQLEVEVSLPGKETYSVSKREMVPEMALALYAVGSTHEVRVDPADPTKIAIAS